MEYELAKQLKEAGFPQKSQFWWHKGKIKWQGGTSKTFEKMVATGYVAAPTISELIEACEGKLFALYRTANGQWFADYHEKDNWLSPKKSTDIFDTLEEVIAKLWLALHANK